MFYNDTYLLPKWDCFPCYMVSYGTLCRIWQNKPAPEGTSVTRVFKLSPAKFVTWCQNLIPWWKFVEPDDKLLHPMIKKVQHGTSGYTILSLGIFFIGLCNFSTRLQIPRVPIWNTGPARSVISWWTILDEEGGGGWHQILIIPFIPKHVLHELLPGGIEIGLHLRIRLQLQVVLKELWFVNGWFSPTR